MILHSLYGVVHKLRLQDKVGIGGLKKVTFCQHAYRGKCQCMGVGGQKKPNSCQGSLWMTLTIKSYKVAQGPRFF